MMAASRHWRRNNTNSRSRSNDTNTNSHCNYNNIVRGSPQVATLRILGLKDPGSPWYLLAGSEGGSGMAILSRIISYTEWGIVPCTCCGATVRPMVFCCQRQQRRMREFRHDYCPDATTTTTTGFENSNAEIIDNEYDTDDEIPTHFLLNVKPHHILLDKYHRIQFGDGMHTFVETSPIDSIMRHRIIPESTATTTITVIEPLPPMFPGGGRGGYGYYIVLNDSGFHYNAFCEQSCIDWKKLDQYSASVKSGSFILARQNCYKHTKTGIFGYYNNHTNNNDQDDRATTTITATTTKKKRTSWAIIKRVHPTQEENFTQLGSFQVKFFSAPHDQTCFQLGTASAERIYHGYRELQRRFRSRTWLGQIAQKNPQHLRELYKKSCV